MSLVPIRTSTLRPNIALSFDIYLLISGRHLLYVKHPDDIEEKRFDHLLEKNVRQVYIDERDLPAYQEFLNASTAQAVNDPSMPLKTRSVILAGQSKAAVEDMFADPDRRENYVRTQSAAAGQVALLLRNPEAIEHMLQIATHDKSTYQHSVNVATLSIGLAASLGAPVETCNVVGVGGLLHDIGKSTREFLQADTTHPMNYEQHPRLGAGVLLNKKYISKDVLDIILLHEERTDGRGYPAGVKKLDQIFQVVGLANLFDKQVTIEGKDPKTAYDTIFAMNPPPYDRRLITALKDVLVANRIY
jgi:putative nucleotidyltransferase with HDIG domain